jgi:hypothetical protein
MDPDFGIPLENNIFLKNNWEKTAIFEDIMTKFPDNYINTPKVTEFTLAFLQDSGNKYKLKF